MEENIIGFGLFFPDGSHIRAASQAQAKRIALQVVANKLREVEKLSDVMIIPIVDTEIQK